MFDWDQDIDTVTDTAPQLSAMAAQSPVEHRGDGLRARLNHIVSHHWMVAGVVVLALGVGGAVAPMMGVSPLSGLFGPTTPSGLLAYDDSQVRAFRAGIARFSDADLQVFAQSTLRGYDDQTSPIGVYDHDALVMIQQEMRQRGLALPVAMLRFDQQRHALASPRGAI